MYIQLWANHVHTCIHMLCVREKEDEQRRQTSRQAGISPPPTHTHTHVHTHTHSDLSTYTYKTTTKRRPLQSSVIQEVTSHTSLCTVCRWQLLSLHCQLVSSCLQLIVSPSVSSTTGVQIYAIHSNTNMYIHAQPLVQCTMWGCLEATLT